MKKKREYGRIGVLMGGTSSEREISLKSGAAVYESLTGAGIEAVAIDVVSEQPSVVARQLRVQAIDCAFIALHGRFGEDGQIQSILDAASIPYTGSGAMASRLAMDKVGSLRIFSVHGIAVPRSVVLERSAYFAHWKSHLKLAYPVVVKPASHGSSIGLSIVDGPAGIDAAVEQAFRYDDRLIVQEFIAGRELTVGILAETPLPVIEIVPKNRFFDYEAKYKAGMTDYILPAQLAPQVQSKVQRLALSAHRLLGCWGCSRVDMILDAKETPFVLEINTIPGMTQTSLLPKAARLVECDFAHLCLRLIDLAYEKTGHTVSP